MFYLQYFKKMFNGFFMILAAVVSGVYDDGATLDITLAAIVTMLVGVLSMFYTRNHKKEVKRKEGYIIVTFGWLVMEYWVSNKVKRMASKQKSFRNDLLEEIE